jgi:hypothetical protein
MVAAEAVAGDPATVLPAAISCFEITAPACRISLAPQGAREMRLRTPRADRLVVAVVVVVVVAASAPSASAAPTPTERYVTLAFDDLLGRDPSPGELSGYSTPLDNLTLTRSAFVSSLLTSAEFADRQTKSYFTLFLQRASTALERGPYVSLLQGGHTFEQIEGTIAGGSEYFANRGGGTNNGFLDAIFPDLLARAIQPTERSGYLGALTSGTTREQVAGAILGSTEYRSDMVLRDYDALLRRDPSPLESNNLVGSALDERSIVNSIVASNEYYILAQSIPDPATSSALLALAFLLPRRVRRHLTLNQNASFRKCHPAAPTHAGKLGGAWLSA